MPLNAAYALLTRIRVNIMVYYLGFKITVRVRVKVEVRVWI